MPHCANCGQQWSWETTVKQSFKIGGAGMTCPNCGAKQYPTTKSRQRGATVAFLPAMGVILSNVAFGLTVWQFLFVAVGMFLLFGIVIYPRTLTLTNEDEPMW
ncbi:TIGR04104 family putative zinc finger protein [Planococcus lenghuensis]|uniref:CXXC-20-CXXC protein n=1 Tax=Planococcus lenghuensis TaxID=2213202 RepID=A0A1Q2KY20_9BACL|nr:TIGR04104 family putative zinc finger protein [Planococcus lenghuensis]AQQ53110.1 hypothetical protein B0X71_08385 [Planococcus lenghuensis]